MSKLAVGDYVELSRKGWRYLRRRTHYGYVIGVNNLPAIKVKFEDSNHEAEWYPVDWFILVEKGKLTGK